MDQEMGKERRMVSGLHGLAANEDGVICYGINTELCCFVTKRLTASERRLLFLHQVTCEFHEVKLYLIGALDHMTSRANSIEWHRS